MAVELATGYIALVPSAKGIGDAIAKELDLDAVATEQGKVAGDALSKGIGDGAKDVSKDLIKKLGLAALGAVAIKSAVDVEDAQNTIIRTTGATGKAADRLEESFRNVASGTAASFETVSTTLSELYQRTGLQGKALEGLTSQVISFNRQFKDSPITVDALTKALAGFNVPGDKMGEVLDHLFIISQKTGVPLQEILGTLQTAGPLARQFGLDVEATATLLAKLNQAGVDANQILPGLKKVFKEAADAGKDPQQALRDIVGQIDALVKANDVIGARNLAVSIFGAKGVGLVDAVISGKLTLQDFNTTINTTGDGILDTGKKTGTLSGALGVLKNNLQLALAEFARPALDAANEALRSILPTVRDLAADFAELPDPVKIGSIALVGLLTQLGNIGQFAEGAAALKGIGSAIADGFVLASVKGLELIETLKAITLAELAAAAAPAAIVVGALAVGFALHSILGEDLIGQITRDFKEGETVGKKWADTLIAGAHATTDPLTSLRANLQTVRDEFERFKADPKKFGVDSFDEGVTAASRFLGEIKSLKGEIDKTKQAQKEEAAQAQETATSLDTYTTATANGTNATSALSNLTDDAKKALSDLQSALLQAAGGEVGYQQSLIARDEAQQRANDSGFIAFAAQLNLNNVVAQFGPDSQEARDAYGALLHAQRDNASAALDLKQANLNVAQSAIGLTDEQQKLLDSVGGTTEGIDAQIAKLELQKQTTPEAADAINPLIFQLLQLKLKVEDIPPTKNTDVTATDHASPVLDVIIGKLGDIIAGANAIVGPLGPVASAAHTLRLPGFAGGGSLAAGEASIVGERGFELFVPDVPGHIIPHDQTLAVLAAPSSPGGGSLFRDLVVQAPTDDPVRLAYETGRNIDTRRHLAGV